MTRQELIDAGWLTWKAAEAQGVERVWIRPTPDNKFEGKFWTFEEAVEIQGRKVDAATSHERKEAHHAPVTGRDID